MSREDEIRERVEKATKGPWHWNVNPQHKQIELRNDGNIVMDFVRWGMGNAMPRFNINGLMVKTSTLTANWPGRDHHASWAQQLLNPDADFIAHAITDIPYLLEELREAREEVERLRKANEELQDRNDDLKEEASDAFSYARDMERLCDILGGNENP